MKETTAPVIEIPGFRDREKVFRDRDHAGAVLAGMLEAYRHSGVPVMAVPAGGVPVAAAIARELGLPLDVAVVSKISFPDDREAGYGAVAFDGTIRLNRELVSRFRLTQRVIEDGTAEARSKVNRRVEAFRGERPYPEALRERVILVDDGLASGFTLLTGVEALRRIGSREVIVAVPTGSLQAVQRAVKEVDRLYCANIRGGWSFAVADAYRIWRDVDEAEALRIFRAAVTDAASKARG